MMTVRRILPRCFPWSSWPASLIIACSFASPVFPGQGDEPAHAIATTNGAVPAAGATQADEPPFGLEHRIPWTTSRVVGSPDPPLPYTVEKTFTNIQWQQPLFIIA